MKICQAVTKNPESLRYLVGSRDNVECLNIFTGIINFFHHYKKSEDQENSELSDFKISNNGFTINISRARRKKDEESPVFEMMFNRDVVGKSYLFFSHFKNFETNYLKEMFEALYTYQPCVKHNITALLELNRELLIKYCQINTTSDYAFRKDRFEIKPEYFFGQNSNGNRAADLKIAQVIHNKVALFAPDVNTKCPKKTIAYLSPGIFFDDEKLVFGVAAHLPIFPNKKLRFYCPLHRSLTPEELAFMRKTMDELLFKTMRGILYKTNLSDLPRKAYLDFDEDNTIRHLNLLQMNLL